ncbi:Fpg/Nei family DNA glycosylase [Bacillus sp. B1-b2]|uniref:Fpg/Nei family DNA glycosylase n=1 Tax=Bacillus sp. B1-b2 TaxID=2653201 RepID=UPI0012620BCB|nr:DNA-formamidopyrimidine glycosylase family protein [Bacillus sp. B1-b2]KAB7671213.1 Fpg/Nei family DNA glycosylase [Bacillus sp. B1-b2]
MPELPEMENYRIQLSQLLVNKPIHSVTINREKSINISSNDFINHLKGSSIVRIERKAKHLLFHLSTNKILLLHLMLGGWMFYGTEEEKPKRTIQIQLSFGDKHLYFIGLRLGYLHLLTPQECEEELKDLGPEPTYYQFTEANFLDYLQHKRGNIKLKLVDQHFLSGIGNCYSDEICYHAKILPTRKIEDLQEIEQKQLYHSIRFILQSATEIGGYMEHPLYKNDQKTGSYNNHCKVYDMEGTTCSRCQDTIVFIELSSKKCFYCPGCQH